MTYTVKQIQEQLGVSQHTVLHWLATGQLKGFNVGRDPGKCRARWRITEQALREFCESRSATTPPPKRTCRRRKLEGVIEFYK